MQNIKVNNKLNLIKQPIKTTDNQTKSVSEPTDRILIFDRSGSMGWTLESLINDVAEQAKLFPDGDTFTAGWFSGSGQFGWICVGLSISENRDKIHDLLERYNRTVGMTNFSEILKDTEKVIDDLSPLKHKVALTFFTDGYANQGVDNIIGSLKAIAPKISSALFVGYGDWYERDLMSKMAKATSGILVHASNLEEYRKHSDTFNKIEYTKKVSVKILGNAQFVFSESQNGTFTSHLMDNNSVLVNEDTKNIYFLTEDTVKSPETDIAEFESAIYGVTKNFLQSGNYLLALDLLGKVGDVYFIDKINNSYTISEYGAVESELQEAVTNTSLRFKSGKNTNYVPKDDAFCILELMDLLAKDENVKFLPYHPSFSYKKIGRPVKTLEGYPKFEAAKTAESPVASLTWSSKELNLSVLSRIPGTVTLDAEAPKYGLDTLFNTFIWRNYSIVSDGKLNVTKLPVKNVSEDTLKVLRENNIIESENGTVVLDLARIPMINRKIAFSYTNLNDACKLVKKETALEFSNKVLGYFFKQLPEDVQEKIDAVIKPTEFNTAQLAYLEKFGIKKDGSFDPPSEAADSTDILTVNEFEFSIDGLKTVPKIEDVKKKVEDSKNKPVKFTTSQSMMSNEISAVMAEMSNHSDLQNGLWLKERLEANRKELRTLRSQLNKVKFAVILGKTNFDQLPTLAETNEHEFDGLKYIITKRTKDKKI